ncbi:hypothetical protein [Paraflavitalea speifideaquila]|uniref:hypothetical protein n=1 Tax=Paraflavitalea speifideaquila TaxID=3076558 RepID=UPI0028E579A3|nr:hypothetical protein [Paraflavitalea speifideiaquila]
MIIYSQFNFLTNEKLGYDDSNLVMVDIRYNRGIKHQDAQVLRDELMKLVGVCHGRYIGSLDRTGNDKLPCH